MSENIETKTEQQQDLSIVAILTLCLSRWYWLAISIVVCLIIAFFHVKSTRPTYFRTAQVVLKSDKRGNSINNDISGISNIGMFTNNSLVLNEIVSMQSPSLMKEVVKRLGLDISYYGSGLWYKPVLYGKNLPVNVEFIELNEEQSASFELILEKEGGFELSGFVCKELEYDDIIKGNFNDTISTPAGKIIVSQGDGYPEWALENANETSSNNFRIFINKHNLSAITSAYMAKTSIALNNKENTVVDINVSDQSIQRASDIVTTLISVYNEQWIADKNLIAISTSHFINNRLQIIEKDLGMVDSDITAFKRDSRIPDINAAAQMYMARNENTERELLKIKTTLELANYLEELITDMIKTNNVLPAINGLDNANIESQITEYNQLVITRDKLVAVSSESNTMVQDYNNSISSMKGAIKSSLNNYIVSLKNQINNLEQSERMTDSQLASSPTQAQQLLSIERQQKVKEALYLFLLQKREENELSQAFTAYNTRVITQAHGSNAPIAPKSSMIYLIALVLGISLPAGFLVAREMMDTKVRIKKDLDGISAPFAGEIPQAFDNNEKKWWQFWKSIDKINKKNGVMIVEEGKRDYVNESFRVLRANIEFMVNRGEKGHVFIMTSFNPGSGKSFLSMNIAMAFAIKKNKVLVIDCDLRHGSSSAYVGSPRKGLSNVLGGRIDDYNEVIVEYNGNQYLNVLPIGPIPPNPSELLYSPKFKEIIDEAKATYDYILLDCPPVNMLADTQILNPYAERTFFIVRAGLMDLAQRVELKELISSKRLSNVALILNASRTSGAYGTPRYGYRYGYHYGYHYGSTYGKGYYGTRKTDYYGSFADVDNNKK